MKKPGWSKSIVLTSMAAAVFGALYLTNDTYIMHQVIRSEDSFTAVSAYLILGGWIGTICILIYNSIFGKWLDSDYPGFNFGTSKMQIFALVSGIIAAGSTAFCLIGNQKLDPSLVTALANLSILYLVFYDGFRGRISLPKIWLPVVLIIGGSILASVTRISGGFEITLIGILFLLIGRCLTDAVEKVIRQEGVWKSDAVTFNFWRFLWLTISGTVMALVIALARGTFDQLIGLLQSCWKPAFPWILLTMFFVFFFNTLFQKALKTGAVSKVSLLLNFQIVLGIPLALAASSLWPGVFGELPSDPVVWLMRFAGAILIIAGIVPLAKKKLELEEKEKPEEKR